MWDIRTEHVIYVMGATKIFALVLAVLCTILTTVKYYKRKVTFVKHLSLMFLTYIGALVSTLTNTFIWYFDYDKFHNSPMPTISGVFYALATSFVVWFTFEVFSKEKTKKELTIIRGSFVMVITVSILSFQYALTNGWEGNPWSMSVAVITFGTYLFTIIKTQRLITKVKDVESEEHVRRLHYILRASIYMIIATLCLSVEHLLPKELSGYTWVSPLGFVFTSLSLWQFLKVIK